MVFKAASAPSACCRSRHAQPPELIQLLAFSVRWAWPALLTVLTAIVPDRVLYLVPGLPAISGEFITGFPRDGMRAGGIWPAIVGTFYLTRHAIRPCRWALPLGSIWPNMPAETARHPPRSASPSSIWPASRRWSTAVRPGAVRIFLKFGTSILAGSLTLAIMTLPVIISTTEEALRAVPQCLPRW